MNQKMKIATIALSLFVLMAFVPSKQENDELVYLGKYSLSLNVNDILESKEFYQKLGFDPVEGMGSVEQKWMIISNGETKIGIFQGMFPSNTITFNPTDGRTICRKIKEKGIVPVFETGMDNSEGPCTFSIVDPDGNPILIDQH
ncbi:MAG: VOC family protein [Crocinitomicaceae bacterium]